MKAMVVALVMVAIAGLTAGHRRAPVAPERLVVEAAQEQVIMGPFPAAVPAVAPAGVEVLLLVR